MSEPKDTSAPADEIPPKHVIEANFAVPAPFVDRFSYAIGRGRCRLSFLEDHNDGSGNATVRCAVTIQAFDIVQLHGMLEHMIKFMGLPPNSAPATPGQVDGSPTKQ